MRACRRKFRVPRLVICVLCTILGFTLREQFFLMDGAYQKYVRSVPSPQLDVHPEAIVESQAEEQQREVVPQEVPQVISLNDVRAHIETPVPIRNVPLQNVVYTSPKTCHPVKNLMFLKTHKTASTTMMNIMYRFTEKHNLSIALPINQMNIFHYPRPFQAEWVEGFLTKKEGQNYNIMCNHLKFNLPEVRKVMPKNTIYLSILRNPVSLLESSYTYFRFLPSINNSKDLNDFLESPRMFYQPTESYHMLVKNTMWYDFGYDSNAEDTDAYVQNALAEIEQSFQLILIAEYFDESMVLLKNTLCWDMEDVVYFKLNARSKESVQHLTPQSQERAKEWCSLDWKLYQHFNKTFWKRIQETIGPEKMKKELELLRSKTKELSNTCLQEGEAIGNNQIKDSNLQPHQEGLAHILGYNIRPELKGDLQRLCYRMALPEVRYLQHMHSYQHPQETVTF